MAPKVGFEPTTYRLTAGCSTFELLRINNWLWPTLPRPFGLSTISDEELNFCVRYGNRCILFSVITILFFSHFKLRPSSLDFISFLSHVLYTLPRLSLVCLELLVLNVKIYLILLITLLSFMSLVSHVALVRSLLTYLPCSARIWIEIIYFCKYIFWLYVVQSKLHIISFQKYT